MQFPTFVFPTKLDAIRTREKYTSLEPEKRCLLSWYKDYLRCQLVTEEQMMPCTIKHRKKLSHVSDITRHNRQATLLYQINVLVRITKF